jgi:hypothetical protein
MSLQHTGSLLASEVKLLENKWNKSEQKTKKISEHIIQLFY